MTQRTTRKMPLDQRRKIAIANLGKKRSAETRKRISEGMKRYWATIPTINEQSEEGKE